MPHDTSLTRRDALAGAGAALLLAGSAAHGQTQPAAPAASATATGMVFEARSEALEAQPGDSGIPGILVSNGREVVRTDAQGRYSIPVSPGQSVFVIKPSGYALPANGETGIAHFAYVFEPDGSPDGLRYGGLAPTGKLPASIDFALRRAEEPSRFDVLLFTDPQPETLAELEYVRRDVIEALAAGGHGAQAEAAVFGITTGDLMFDDLSAYPRYNRMVGTIGLPWYSLPGNHDIDVDAPSDRHSRDTFRRVFGARHYAFQYGGATFLMLDNVEYAGEDPQKPGALGKYRGYFGAEQLAFVRAVLAEVPRDALVVCCFHIPLRTVVGGDPNIAAVDARDFLAAIGSHPNSISFCGHTHTNEHHYLGAADGFAAGEHHQHVLAAVSGSWWSGPFDVRGIPVALQSDGAPNGYHLLSVDGSAASTRVVPAHDPAASQIRLMLDSQMHGRAPEVLDEYPIGRLLTGPIDAGAVAGTRLVANVFDGGPRSRVALSVDGGPAVKMERVERTDPFVEEVYARNAATKKPWVNPTKSSHVWQVALPRDLRAGAMHLLEVRATDEHGREHVASMVLEVTTG